VLCRALIVITKSTTYFGPISFVFVGQENGGKLPFELRGIDDSTLKVYKDDPGKKIVHADFKAPKKIYFEQSESKNLHKQEDNTSFLENETVRDVNIGKMEELDAIRVVNLRAGPGRNSCCYGMVQSI